MIYMPIPVLCIYFHYLMLVRTTLFLVMIHDSDLQSADYRAWSLQPESGTQNRTPTDDATLFFLRSFLVGKQNTKYKTR